MPFSAGFSNGENGRGAYTFRDGNQHFPASGGCAGGFVNIMSKGTITITGEIIVNGGNAGAGGAGGGPGGTIILESPKLVHITKEAVLTSKGGKGSGTINGATGGNGTDGVIVIRSDTKPINDSNSSILWYNLTNNTKWRI